jgi:RNA polymerase sigma-70 factor (family 1)
LRGISFYWPAKNRLYCRRLIVLKDTSIIPRIKERIALGDQSAYKELFELFYHRLLRLAFIITKSRELSEEIVSDVFIGLWRNRETIPAVDNLTVYLYVAIRNTSLNYLSRLTKTTIVNLDDLDFEPEQPFADPEQALITKEMNNRIYRAIQSLPPRCRIIFKLVKEDGLTYREAAEVLHLSIGTIDNQLVLALKKLSRALFYSFRKEKKY